MGLLLGASALTVCELLDFLILITVRKCKTKQVENVSGDPDSDWCYYSTVALDLSWRCVKTKENKNPLCKQLFHQGNQISFQFLFLVLSNQDVSRVLNGHASNTKSCSPGNQTTNVASQEGRPISGMMVKVSDPPPKKNKVLKGFTAHRWLRFPNWECLTTKLSSFFCWKHFGVYSHLRLIRIGSYFRDQPVCLELELRNGFESCRFFFWGLWK